MWEYKNLFALQHWLPALRLPSFMAVYFETFSFPASLRWQDIADIGIVSYLVYRAIILIRGTRAVQMIVGALVIALLYFLSISLDLLALQLVLRYLLSSILLIVIVVFQDDIRRALTEMGKTPFFKGQKIVAASNLTAVISAAVSLSRRRIGALIIIERETGLLEYIKTGFILDAKLLQELLVAIFIPSSPMHDGAVVVKKGRIHSAGCLLPLSKNPAIDKRYGTRHRAAIGLSEETDAVIIVVSEETQEISVVHGGKITPMRDEERLEAVLKNIFFVQNNSTSFWKRWSRKKAQLTGPPRNP